MVCLFFCDKLRVSVYVSVSVSVSVSVCARVSSQDDTTGVKQGQWTIHKFRRCISAQRGSLATKQSFSIVAANLLLQHTLQLLHKNEYRTSMIIEPVWVHV
jgi:hypothetical protein